MDWLFIQDIFRQMLVGIPLTLELTVVSLLAGFVLAGLVQALVSSRHGIIRRPAAAYVELFRGTPLLLQIFLIYYGLGQIDLLRQSFLWTLLREPYWCAVLALTLNTSAYTAEIIRGAVQAVPPGEIEAARSCGMSGLLLRRRIVWPIAIRHGLPVYSSEVIQMVKATSLASIITLNEITGITYRLASDTYRVIEIFTVAGFIYLSLNFVVSLVFAVVERFLNGHLADRRT